MLPEDQIRFLIGVIISVPLGFSIRFLPNYEVRKMYSVIVSMILQYYVYDYPFLFAVLLNIFIFFIITKVKRQNCGFYTTIASMVVVSTYYIYVMIIDYGRWQIDISSILMMAICKHSLFAFSYQDGQQQLKKQNPNDQRILNKIQKLPSFYDYFAYMNFMPSAVFNTPFDYQLYQNFMKKQKQFKQIPLKKLLLRFGRELIGTIACLIIYVISMNYIPTSAMKQKGYIQQGIFHHIWYSILSINLHKYKYFFGFLLMQLPIHASGISYKPSEKSTDQFEGIKTVSIYKFETAYHIRDKINNWNMMVQQWLRRCIYQRLPYNKSTNQLLTFMVSAFWHGYYLGYYLTFLFYFLQIAANNSIYKFVKSAPNHFILKIYKKAEPISYYIIWMIWIGIFVNNSAYFIILQGEQGYSLLKSSYFMSPLFLIILNFVFKNLTPRRQIDKKQ